MREFVDQSHQDTPPWRSPEEAMAWLQGVAPPPSTLVMGHETAKRFAVLVAVARVRRTWRIRAGVALVAGIGLGVVAGRRWR